MGIVRNIFACYILAFVLITHFSLLLCVKQEIEQQNPLLVKDSPKYDCPKIEGEVLEWSSKLLSKIPEGPFIYMEATFDYLGVKVTNTLIIVGLIALLGDFILFFYYAIIQPLKLLQTTLSILLRLLVLGFLTVFILRQLVEHKVINNIEFLEKILSELPYEEMHKFFQSTINYLKEKFEVFFK